MEPKEACEQQWKALMEQAGNDAIWQYCQSSTWNQRIWNYLVDIGPLEIRNIKPASVL